MPLPKNERDDASNDAAALAIVIGNEQADSGLSSKSLEAISCPNGTSESEGSYLPRGLTPHLNRPGSIC